MFLQLTMFHCFVLILKQIGYNFALDCLKDFIINIVIKADLPETRLHGLDTIICVDLSASMSNKVLEQIQATIYSFLDSE